MTEITKDMLDLRTKPTVTDGVKFDVEYVGGPGLPTVRFVDYQPGNGTRYWISITDTDGLHAEINDNLGFGGSSGYIVTDLNCMRSMVLAREGFISFDFIMQKMQCGISDAYVLAELLGELVGREYEKAGP